MIVHLLSLQYPRHIRYAQDPNKSLGQPRSIVRCPGCCKASSSVPLTLVTTHQSNTLLSAPPREPLTPHLSLYPHSCLPVPDSCQDGSKPYMAKTERELGTGCGWH